MPELDDFFETLNHAAPWIAGSGPLLSGLTLDLFQFASKGHLHLRRGESGRGVFWWRHEHLFE